MESPTSVVLALFGVLFGAIVVRGYLSRGKNLLEKLELLPGEEVLGEHDIELSSMPRRRAMIQSLYFAKARARITSHRVLLAQPGLGMKGALVLRFVVYRGGGIESVWRYGYHVLEVDKERSGSGERGGELELRIAPRDDAPNVPSFAVVRGPGREAVAEALGVAGKRATVD